MTTHREERYAVKKNADDDIEEYQQPNHPCSYGCLHPSHDGQSPYAEHEHEVATTKVDEAWALHLAQVCAERDKHVGEWQDASLPVMSPYEQGFRAAYDLLAHKKEQA